MAAQSSTGDTTTVSTMPITNYGRLTFRVEADGTTNQQTTQDAKASFAAFEPENRRVIDSDRPIMLSL
jgi:hypothetical protein